MNHRQVVNYGVEKAISTVTSKTTEQLQTEEMNKARLKTYFVKREKSTKNEWNAIGETKKKKKKQ